MAKVTELKPYSGETVFGGKGILIPFARRPAESSKRISPSQKRTEMSREAAPKGFFYQLTTAVAQYGKRFGHPVPMYPLRELEPKELLDQLNRALSEGKPVPGWLGAPTSDLVMDRPAQAEQPAQPPTTGAPTSTTKRTGVISRTVGAAYSRKDSGTLSFAFFRTPDGKPPKKDPESKN